MTKQNKYQSMLKLHKHEIDYTEKGNINTKQNDYNFLNDMLIFRGNFLANL